MKSSKVCQENLLVRGKESKDAGHFRVALAGMLSVADER
jgi:hypothetical protein